jgi:hypothetical protein
MMARVNVGELIHDPDFAQDFEVIRKAGKWVDGRFETQASTIPMRGVVVPNSTKGLVQSPDGDAIQGTIEIYTHEALYTTQLSEESFTADRVSDEVVWRRQTWKIIDTEDFRDYGYYKAIAERKRGA